MKFFLTLAPTILDSLSLPSQKYLAIVNSMDVTAKPFGEGFHNALFSRLIKRMGSFMANSVAFSYQDRLRQLMGPANYTWLTDEDADKLNEAVIAQGLPTRKGFELLIEHARFDHWPVLKDLVTPEIERTISYYTPFQQEYAVHLARFLLAISLLLEKVRPDNEVFIKTEIDYFKFSLRPAFLAGLRAAVLMENLEIAQEAENRYSCGNLTMTVLSPETGLKIELGLR